MRTLTLDHVCCTLNVSLKLIVGAAWATPTSNVGCINPIAWPIANESERKEKKIPNLYVISSYPCSSKAFIAIIQSVHDSKSSIICFRD